MRQSPGEAKPYQRASDGLWVAAIPAGFTAKGTRRRITVSAKTEAECKRRLRDKRRELDREGSAPGDARMTVKRWSETWLARRQQKIRPKPWATDAGAVRRWIVPTIGHRRLDQLTPADLRAVSTAMLEGGLSPNTARRHHSTLHKMLEDAILEGFSVPQRVLLVEPVNAQETDGAAMTAAEMRACLAVAAELPHGSRWVFALLNGVRPAEGLGLTWDAIDFDARTITIEWQLQELTYRKPRDPSSGFRVPVGFECRQLVDTYHLTRPKTRSGKRVIPLLPGLAEALLWWREQAPDNPWGLVWPAANGRPARMKDDRLEWHAIQATAEVGHPDGRPYKLHETRHATATRLRELGADDQTITAILGHASILSTTPYLHVSQEQARVSLDQLAALLAAEIPALETR